MNFVFKSYRRIVCRVVDKQTQYGPVKIQVYGFDTDLFIQYGMQWIDKNTKLLIY